jgi:hypothetical protein
MFTTVLNVPTRKQRVKSNQPPYTSNISNANRSQSDQHGGSTMSAAQAQTHHVSIESAHTLNHPTNIHIA